MKKYVKATTLKAYLEKFASDPMKYDENLASFVNYDNGTANFWIHPETGKWTLVIMDENTYNPDTYIYEGKYYGDEELMDENCNDIQLTTDQLYSELQKLPGVDLQNFYGMRNLIDELDGEAVISSTDSSAMTVGKLSRILKNKFDDTEVNVQVKGKIYPISANNTKSNLSDTSFTLVADTSQPVQESTIIAQTKRDVFRDATRQWNDSRLINKDVNKLQGLAKACYRIRADIDDLRHEIDTLPDDYSWYLEALGDAEDAIGMLAHALEQV